MSNAYEPWIEELLRVESESPRMTEKQRRIVESAVEVFAEKGFAASSTSEIAQRAGVAEGTIFRHYKTKKDLLLSIVTPGIVKLLAPFLLREFKNVLQTGYDSYEQFLRAFIDNRIAFVEENASMLKIVLQELPFHPDLQRTLEELVVTQVLERVTRVVEKFQREGQLIMLPTRTVIRLSVGTIMSYVLVRALLLQRGAEWDDEAERKATIDFIMKGLAP
ncbi:TetR/AcrR family transcriptional regulator [Paenibacillus methanolicus]|uniref:AcrR family transcriptional regulator n=1 Tax=Paenibacillus methanolicus TaxID=582686 RepID=A0A5S5CKW0_9BACL|nr:TetR/AcrR family transcriptional regulator [Paenibacillus methanolicus]TYP79603.1 AcrR family transcriptional regulator [Paenibacillus methanolicus]